MAGVSFFIASRRSMFLGKDLGNNRCLWGKRGAVSPWLIAIFGELMDLPHSILH
jgi:hypothetical protein